MHLERNSRKLIVLLERDGWYLVDVRGDHHQFKHPTLSGRVTVPHPNKDIAIGTLRSTARLAGWRNKMRYVAFVHKDPDSPYGISFPDFPGCISVGATMDDVIANGTEALAFHVSGMETDGDPIPQPRPLEDIVNDPEFVEDRKGASFALVPLVRDLGSTTRINVSLDLGLLKAIDDEARSRKQTRSAFIASAVRRELVE